MILRACETNYTQPHPLNQIPSKLSKYRPTSIYLTPARILRKKPRTVYEFIHNFKTTWPDERQLLRTFSETVRGEVWHFAFFGSKTTLAQKLQSYLISVITVLVAQKRQTAQKRHGSTRRYSVPSNRTKQMAQNSHYWNKIGLSFLSQISFLSQKRQYAILPLWWQQPRISHILQYFFIY